MRSIGEFVLVALVVTLKPGPATALVLRVTVRDGRRAALGAVLGNALAICRWAFLALAPKLAMFFIALCAQFLRPGTAVLPAALGMAAAIVCFDLMRFGTLIVLVDRAGVASACGGAWNARPAP